ncbi:MAG: pyrroline-5-carboxylate reductase [Betaproteobacteria bacterium]|nr:pyrroline-5-carboxylate reductase [Betaproteobacteria bacterium]
MQILFVGGGNMATALISGLINQGVLAEKISVVARNAVTAVKLADTWSVRVMPAWSDEILASVQVIVLAVKPQQLRAVAQQLAPSLSGQLVLSIAAGVRLDVLSRWLNAYASVVRAMPNTPAMVGAGVTGMFAGEQVTAAQREQAESIMQATGSVFWVENEAQMDAVTAVSGSGPAYVFYFMEAMQQAAIELGLPTHVAQVLTLQTFAGAAKLAASSTEAVGTLRQRVTSPGGTTERALLSMQTDGVSEAIKRAISAASARSGELGDLLAMGD